MPALPQQHDLVARLFDQLQAQGRLVASVDELVKLSGLTLTAVRRQLDRLSPRVVRLPGRPPACLVVPPEHRVRGAPPVAGWLDAYFHLRGDAYYLGLLSAAALHGSSRQAVQLTQILTTKPLRPMDIGRLHLDFYVKATLGKTPLTRLPGMPAPLAVSTPEATALDLIAFSHRIGGISRVTQVIADLKPAMTLTGLRQALTAETQTSVKQRLGYVLQSLGWERMAAEVHKDLPPRLTVVLLQTHAQASKPVGNTCQPWMVLDNIGLGSGRE